MHSQVTRFVVLVAIATVAVSVVAWAQSPRGASKATIGGSEVSVDYGRPSLRGRDMLGQATLLGCSRSRWGETFRAVDRSVPSTIPERDEVHGRDPRSVSSGATPSCGASQKASHVEST